MNEFRCGGWEDVRGSPFRALVHRKYGLPQLLVKCAEDVSGHRLSVLALPLPSLCAEDTDAGVGDVCSRSYFRSWSHLVLEAEFSREEPDVLLDGLALARRIAEAVADCSMADGSRRSAASAEESDGETTGVPCNECVYVAHDREVLRLEIRMHVDLPGFDPIVCKLLLRLSPVPLDLHAAMIEEQLLLPFVRLVAPRSYIRYMANSESDAASSQHSSGSSLSAPLRHPLRSDRSFDSSSSNNSNRDAEAMSSEARRALPRDGDGHGSECLSADGLSAGETVHRQKIPRPALSARKQQRKKIPPP